MYYVAFAALQWGKMAAGKGIAGTIRSYNGMARGVAVRLAAAAREKRPGGGGSAGAAGPVCYISL